MTSTNETLDQKARFEACLAPILGLAYGTALHMVHHREDAEDLVQEAAIRAYHFFSSFQEGTNFKAWFFKILTNLILNRSRKRSREPAVVSLDAEERDLELYHQTRKAGLQSRHSDPAAQLLGKIETEEVVSAIEALPEEYRIVSSLYFMGSFSYEEISEMIGCPIGTVRSRLSRGRKRLQKLLWQAAVDRGIVATLKTKGS